MLLNPKTLHYSSVEPRQKPGSRHIFMENPDVSLIPDIVDSENDRRRVASKINAISVEQDTNVRDPHLSIITSPPPVDNLDDCDDDDVDYELVPSTPPPSPSSGKKRPRSGESGIENGESLSNSKKNNNDQTSPFMCEICVEPKPMNESFNIAGCTHFYCTECMIKYIACKLQVNITGIGCPVSNCPGRLEPEHCRGILPPEVFERWGNALCESGLLASEKFYCPFKDCFALYLHGEGGEVITQSKCPKCKRSLCVQCKAAWHNGIECEEFQKMKKDEREEEGIMMMQLAKEKRWTRCPNCRFYVERINGCNHMMCRCGCIFCYSCGDTNLYRCSCYLSSLSWEVAGGFSFC